MSFFVWLIRSAGSCLFLQDISICRTVTPSAAMGIIAPRDFVDVILVQQYEDGTISSNGTYPLIPDCVSFVL